MEFTRSCQHVMITFPRQNQISLQSIRDANVRELCRDGLCGHLCHFYHGDERHPHEERECASQVYYHLLPGDLSLLLDPGQLLVFQVNFDSNILAKGLKIE